MRTASRRVLDAIAASALVGLLVGDLAHVLGLGPVPAATVAALAAGLTVLRMTR